MSEENILQLISTISEFNDVHELMKDDELDTALAHVIKLIAKPDVPSNVAPRLIVQLQALSAKFAVMATAYMTIHKDRAGTTNNHKKNIYYTMNGAIDRLVDALKYAARNQYDS